MQGGRAVLPYPQPYAMLAGTLLPWHCTCKAGLFDHCCTYPDPKPQVCKLPDCVPILEGVAETHPGSLIGLRVIQVQSLGYK